MMSGGVFLEVLSICYNRTGAFLVISTVSPQLGDIECTSVVSKLQT